ncbi:CHAP domain-containing protein [Bifidobacterium sp. IMAU50987]
MELNRVAPPTRRSMRMAAKAAQRRTRLLTGSAMAALAGAAAGAVAFLEPAGLSYPTLADGAETSVVSSRSVGDQDVSRAQSRAPLSTVSSVNREGTWQLGGEDIDTSQLSRPGANNPVVASLMEKDRESIPAGFNPDHPTGDTGNAYAFSQCTWWVYIRRHQLGLPVGSRMGDGRMWAASALSLGYWVDNVPRNVGDIIVFQAGQEGSSPQYGHVAIVEKINADGSVVTSECGEAMQGKQYSRTLTNVSSLQFIHY